jgi:hypothetical protein
MHSRPWQVSIAGWRGQRPGRCCRSRRQWRHAVAGDMARGRGGIPCPGVKSRHSRTGSRGEILCRVERGVPCCHAVCLAANIVSDGRLRHLTILCAQRQAVLLAVCCLAHCTQALHTTAGAVSNARGLSNLRLSGGSEGTPSLKATNSQKTAIW